MHYLNLDTGLFLTHTSDIVDYPSLGTWYAATFLIPETLFFFWKAADSSGDIFLKEHTMFLTKSLFHDPIDPGTW
jgi:hypothetical protein